MKKTYELIAPCHFGLEAVLKKEIVDLGYEISQVEDGRVTFTGDDEAICRANVFLRTAERVLVKAGSFRAESFEELFQNTRAIEWEEFFPQDAKFWVAKASSIKSKLFSPSDIQRIMKKAMVERMKEHAQQGTAYNGKCFLSQSSCPEDAGAVAGLVEETFPQLNGKVFIVDIGTVIGSHTGPGTVCLVFWGDERTV